MYLQKAHNEMMPKVSKVGGVARFVCVVLGEQERRDQNDLKELVIFILGGRGRRISEHL